MTTQPDHAEHVRLWCTCPPDADDICEYRLVADKIIILFNPADDDIAEPAIMIRAVEQAAGFIAGLPCTCTPEMVDDYQACGRCAALGQLAGKPADR